MGRGREVGADDEGNKTARGRDALDAFPIFHPNLVSHLPRDPHWVGPTITKIEENSQKKEILNFLFFFFPFNFSSFYAGLKLK